MLTGELHVTDIKMKQRDVLDYYARQLGFQETDGNFYSKQEKSDFYNLYQSEHPIGPIL